MGAGESLVLACCTLAAVAAAAIPAQAGAVVAAPAWAPLAAAGPTNLAPGEEGTIALYAQNVGGAPSTGPITLTDTLPAGILTTDTPFDPSHVAGWVCSAGAGQSTIECTEEKEEEVPPGLTPNVIDVPVEVEAGAVTGENVLTVSGGGAAAAATFEDEVTISDEPAKPGVAALTVGTYDADGTPTTLAASHPYASDVGVLVNTVRTKDKKAVVPAGDPKTIAVDLPPGFLGNPTATARCIEGLQDTECPLESQVGLAAAATGNFGNTPNPAGVHSVEAPIGYPAKFTFGIAAGAYQANLLASLRSDEDYGVTVTAPNIAQITPVYGSFASIWGTPAAPGHDPERCKVVGGQGAAGVGCGPVAKGTEEKAFVTMASDCALQAEAPPFARVFFDSWQEPGNFDEETFPIKAVSDCAPLNLGGAAFSFEPERKEAASPTAVETELTLPEGGLTKPEERAAPPLKHALITFPAGVTLNPAAGDGLETCSLKQIGFREFGPEPNRIRFDKEPNHCPDASKVGSLEVQTALLDKPLKGSLYLAAQNDNPFKSLFAVYLVIEDPAVGITIKLPGEVRADPVTGQLSTVFDDLPPAAVGTVAVALEGGDRAPLATPDTCGTFTTRTRLTPWSAPESGPDTLTESSFEVSAAPGGGPCVASEKAHRPFAPTLTAGSSSTAAGAYSPFELKITRRDGEGELKGVSLTLPPGLAAKFAGLGTCSEAEIAAAQAKSGRAELAAPSCPASSQVGTVTTAAGVGATPLHVGGKVYLAPPYKGAPLSFVAIIPAVTGPFDLGDVVNRTAVYLDPESAQPTAVTDPIPDILKGVPVALRQVKIDLDRPGFALAPTSCAAKTIKATLTGAGGDTASTADDVTKEVSVPFQVAGCENLAFKPKFSARLKGGTARNRHPALKTTLSYPPGPGYANTAFAQVALPHSEFLDQAHIDTVCTRVQFAAHTCPAGSIYGFVEASTPLLDEPLSGPIYLRSSSHQLPDVVIALKGPPSRPIEIDLDGRIDSIHGGIRTTFESIPDAPVSQVLVSLKGGDKGLMVNSRDLCSGKKGRVTVRLVGQNGRRADQFPVLGDDCGGKKGKGRHRHGNVSGP
jgi:hypothetical protein